MINMTAEEFYKKSQKFIRSRTHYLKDDFPAYAVEWFLKKERNGYDLNWLWIDYLRKTNGDFRSLIHRDREFVEYDAISEARHSTIQSERDPTIDLEYAGLGLSIVNSFITQREYSILEMTNYYTHRDIAKIYAVTESRISQIITKINDYAEISNAIIEKKYERDLDIQWITI